MRIDQRLLIAALTLVSSCHNTTESGRASSDLDENRQRWAAQKLSRYEFTFDRGCFCAPVGALRVSVRDGNVVGVTVIATGASIDTRGVPTVDSLFVLIERGIANHSAVLQVTYDPVMGYPKQIYSDGSYQIADDEVTYTLKDLVSVKF